MTAPNDHQQYPNQRAPVYFLFRGFFRKQHHKEHHKGGGAPQRDTAFFRVGSCQPVLDFLF